MNLSNIQGNIIGGFNKDFQAFLFLRFRTAAGGRVWLAEISDDDNEFGVAASSSKDVLAFNARFKALGAKGLKPESFIAAAWTTLSISFAGLSSLGLQAGTLSQFPTAFRQGMAARSTDNGDIGASAPNHWIAPFAEPANLHALMVVAADSEASLALRVANIRATGAFIDGVETLALIDGRTREDAPGHEHFGFKDGVSQPGIRTIDQPDDSVGNPDQGHPGQDLLWPGEFVLGYLAQDPKPEPGHTGPNRNAGDVSKSGPAWTADGSYLVFRRLEQDVPAFTVHVAALAAANKVHPDLMGAKLVGRYKSGCPLEARAFQPHPFKLSATDPERFNPGVADNDTLNNDFEFGDDAGGATCPMASHIRKAYPRDENTPTGGEPDTQTHRLLRRGIPFGRSVGHTDNSNESRGLLFQCYQRSIEDQFEFVQRNWINDANFPPGATGGAPGQDPIIAQSATGPFQLTPGQASIDVSHFVKTTGGEYFFATSIKALQDLGSGAIV